MDFNDYLTQKHAPEGLRKRLTGISAAEAGLIGHIIATLNPSANALRSLLFLVDEIVCRDGSSAEATLGAPEIREILLADGLSRKEKQKKVRLVLEALRYPEISRVRKKAEELQRRISERYGIKLEHPADFEGDALSFNAAGRSADDFLRLGASLQLLAADPLLGDYLALLTGDGTE